MGEHAPKKRKFSDLENGQEVTWVQDQLNELQYPRGIITQVTESLAGDTLVTLKEASMEDLKALFAEKLENPKMAQGIARALYKRIHPMQLPVATGHDHRTL